MKELQFGASSLSTFTSREKGLILLGYMPLILIGIFVVSTLVGYKIIGNVPSLLHTPLMSGMNALSGVTVLGALSATAAAVHTQNQVLGVIAIFLAMLNVAGGFSVTNRMLKMFHSKEEK